MTKDDQPQIITLNPRTSLVSYLKNKNRPQKWCLKNVFSNQNNHLQASEWVSKWISAVTKEWLCVHSVVYNYDVTRTVARMYRPNFYESTCFRCNEIVYQVDRVGPLKDFTFFHSGCFKCAVCGTKLTLKVSFLFHFIYLSAFSAS